MIFNCAFLSKVFGMGFFILGIILIIIAVLLCIAAINKAKYAEEKLEESKNITLTKNAEQEEYNNLISSLLEQINDLHRKKDKVNEEIIAMQNLYLQKKQNIEEEIKKNENNLSYAGQQYVAALEKEYTRLEANFDKSMQELKQKENEYKDHLKQYDNEILKAREVLAAHAKAALREQEKKNKLEFYKLNLTPFDLEDIIKLNTIKAVLHQPVILSKLIWSTYFQKQTTEMCNRILGTEKVCGIYRITYIETEQSYIGQSVDVAQRWKDHVKCGLGIDAPATNKLYNAMQNKGVWNFTFELLEACSRDQLNEKEKFWIESYQSNLYGYNSTKGNG